MERNALWILACGLALFLYGLQLMEQGLSGALGRKLGHILEKMTDTSLKAVLVGAGATALLQSSSVTTVLVVSLVDVGNLSLRQAAGIIMGANVGTTVTAWILGMNGDWKVSTAMLLVTMGVGIRLFRKEENLRSLADALIGFSALIFGMDTMGSTVSPLSATAEFNSRLWLLMNPWTGVLTGLVLTALIQSSSASVGILQALCNTGTVNFRMALPFIMGQNIGTCVTALLSCVGVGIHAKRAAFLHLYFNVIATAVFLILFCIFEAIAPDCILNKTMDGLAIAGIHSLFNVGAVVLLLPFSDGLIKLTCLTVRSVSATCLKQKA